MSVMAMYSPILIQSSSWVPQRIFKQGLISSNLKFYVIWGRAPEFGVKVEESIYAISLTNWRTMSSHRDTIKELAYFFVGSGKCLSNRFKITGFRGTSLVVQWLRLRVSTAGDTGLIPGQGTKIPQAMQYSQKIYIT